MAELGRRRASELGREIEAEGFELEELRRQKAGWVELVSARKPA
jgi:hypothetical protein